MTSKICVQESYAQLVLRPIVAYKYLELIILTPIVCKKQLKSEYEPNVEIWWDIYNINI